MEAKDDAKHPTMHGTATPPTRPIATGSRGSTGANVSRAYVEEPRHRVHCFLYIKYISQKEVIRHDEKMGLPVLLIPFTLLPTWEEAQLASSNAAQRTVRVSEVNASEFS